MSGSVFTPLYKQTGKPWYGNNHIAELGSYNVDPTQTPDSLLNRRWVLPTFTPLTDIPNSILGFISGALGVFPSDSMATYCR